MSNHFKVNDYQIHEEDELSRSARVVKTSETAAPTIENFQFNNIRQDHATSRARSGGKAMPTTDGRDKRFVLSQLAREALSIGREEEKVIDDMVRERVEVITSKARDEAAKKGYEDGLKRGRQEAQDQFQIDASERLRQVDALVQSMETAKTEVFEANREFLLDVSYRVATAVLLRELQTDKQYLLRLARELIEKSGLRDNLVLRIHPKDIQSLAMLREGLQESFSTLKNLAIEASENVTRGGCILESEFGAFDATLDTQLSQLLKTLHQPEEVFE